MREYLENKKKGGGVQGYMRKICIQPYRRKAPI